MEKKLEEYIDLQLNALEQEKQNKILEINVISGRISELKILKSGEYAKAVADYNKIQKNSKQVELPLDKK